MKILLRHITRSIIEKKFRTIIIIFAIMFTAAILYINFHLKDVIVESYSSFNHETSGETDILITDEEEYLFQEKDISLDTIKTNQRIPFLTNLGKYENEDNEKSRIALTGVDEELAEDADLVNIMEKQNNEAFVGNKLIVSQQFAEDNKLELGQEIDVTINDEKKNFEVYGLASKNGLFYDETMQSQMLLPIQEINTIIDQENAISGMYLDVASDNIQEDITHLEEVNPELTVQSTVNEEELNEQLSMISMVLIIALILMLILSGTMLSAMYKHIQNDRLPSVATFKSIGASKFATTLILIIETIIYGVIGGVLGVLLANLSMPYIYDMVVTNQLIDADIKLDITKAALSVLLVVTIAVLITGTTIRSLSKRSLKDSIFNTVEAPFKLSGTFTIIGSIMIVAGILMVIFVDQTDSAISLVSPLLTIIGFAMVVPFLNSCFISIMESVQNIIKPTTMLAAKNNKKSKIIIQNIRVSSIIAVLVICIFSISIAFSSLLSQTQHMNADVVVDLDEYTAKEDTEEILDLNGVDNSLVLFAENLKLKGKDNEEKTVQLVGRDAEDNLDVVFPDAIKFDEYSITDLEENEIIIDEKLLQWLEKKTGDSVTLQLDDREFEYKIKGTMDSYNYSSGSNTIFVPKETYTKEITNKPNLIYLTSKLDPDKQVTQIEDTLLDTNSTVLTFEEFIDNQQDMVDSIMFIVNLVVIAGLLIGLLGIINNLVIGYIARKKEFAVLYSCVTNKKQLKRIIFTEVILQLTISLVLCFGLSFILVLQLNDVLEYLEVGIQLTYPFTFMLIIFALIIVIEVISTVFMFKIINNLQIMKELRYE